MAIGTTPGDVLACAILDPNAPGVEPGSVGVVSVVPDSPNSVLVTLSAPVDASGVAVLAAMDGDPANVRAVSVEPTGSPTVWRVSWASAGGGGGGVTAVTASAPLASSGGATPDVSLTAGMAPGDVLTWSGAAWSAAQPSSPGITGLTNDVTATGPGSAAAVVVGLQNTPLYPTAPAAGQVLTFDGVWWSPATPATVTASILPFRAGAWVDPTNPNAADDGDTATPFVTIQGAINALQADAQAASGGFPYTSAVQKQPRTVWVAAGIYDEDVTCPAALCWNLIAMGSVTLGNGAGNFLVSTNARNLTWEVNGNLEPSSVGQPQARPTLFLTTWTEAPTSSTHTAYSGGWIVSGEFRMVQTGDPLSPFSQSTTELHFNQVKITGQVVKDVGGVATGIVNAQFRHCFLDSAVSLPSGNVQIAYDTEFDSTLACNTYCRLTECELNGNITVATGFSEDLPPGGFLSCKFTALTFTCAAAGSFRVDPYSNATAKAAPVTLAGGATKIIIGDTTP